MIDLRRLISRVSEQDGFTLIEVLVAAIVLVVGILGTAKLTVGSESTTLDAELQQVATEQAEQQLERARALSYGEVGDATTPTQEPSGSNALQGSEFTAPDTSDPEELVTPSTGATQAQLDPVTTFTVDQGDGRTISGTAYTYVSWRNEDCGAISLTGNAQLSNLQSQLQSLRAQLAVTADKITQAQAKLTNAVINQLGSQAQELSSELIQLSDSVTATQNKIDALLASGGPIDSLLNAQVDLCDIAPAIFDDLSSYLGVDVSNVSPIIDQLGTVDSAIEDLLNSTQLSTLITDLSNGICTLTPSVCNLLVNPIVTGVVNPLLDALDGGGSGPVADELDTLTATLNALPDIDAALLGGDSSPSRNTKRVTVAVTIDSIARQDITPKNPVWLSTVITDPRTGLLGLGGSS